MSRKHGLTTTLRSSSADFENGKTVSVGGMAGFECLDESSNFLDNFGIGGLARSSCFCHLRVFFDAFFDLKGHFSGAKMRDFGVILGFNCTVSSALFLAKAINIYDL
jgi:hypothetical protein